MLHANKRNLANEACVRPESDWVDERWTWLAETSESFSLQSSYLFFFSPKLQAIWKASSTFFFFNMSAIIKLALHFKHTIFTHHPVLPLLDVFSLLFVCGCYRCCRYLLNSRIFVGLFLRIFLVFLLFFFLVLIVGLVTSWLAAHNDGFTWLAILIFCFQLRAIGTLSQVLSVSLHFC